MGQTPMSEVELLQVHLRGRSKRFITFIAPKKSLEALLLEIFFSLSRKWKKPFRENLLDWRFFKKALSECLISLQSHFFNLLQEIAKNSDLEMGIFSGART